MTDEPVGRMRALLRKARDFITATDTEAIARRAGAIALVIRVTSAGLEEDLLMEIKDVLRAHPGSCPVFFEVETTRGVKVLVKTTNEHFISPSDRFLADIEEVLGTGHVRLVGKPTK